MALSAYNRSVQAYMQAHKGSASPQVLMSRAAEDWNKKHPGVARKRKSKAKKAGRRHPMNAHPHDKRWNVQR